MIGPNCRCGHPPELADTAPLYRWPPGQVVTWCLDPSSPIPIGLSEATVEWALADAMAAWPSVCGVQVRPSPDWSPNILVQFGSLDPSGEILGLTQLPDGRPQVPMRLNLAVAWTADELRTVAEHEFGHALGFVHTIGQPAIMNKTYQPAITSPQPPDITQALARYPLAATLPTPDTSALPALTVDRSFVVEASFAVAGDSILSVAFASSAPIAIPVRIERAGPYRFTIELEPTN